MHEVRQYQVVIGLEVHAQLSTRRKLFSSEPVTYGELPNTATGVITLAHPGTLPVLNREAVVYAIKMGLACGSKIADCCHFDRKSYYYADLPKGYQITQEKVPICSGGGISIKQDGGQYVPLQRIHLEEDTGKSIHDLMPDKTLLDFNRAGIPLIEIVTAPAINSAQEAYECLLAIRNVVQYLDICDGNMEEGALRCDANISLMFAGSLNFGQRVEVKNMNSMRHVKLAIGYEIERQRACLERGEAILAETRRYDAATNSTVHMRSKEGARDYRYMPEPDVSPLIIDRVLLDGLKKSLPPLPHVLYKQFTEVYGLSAYDAGILIADRDMALFFRDIVGHTKAYKVAVNWLMGPIKSYMNDMKIRLADWPLSAVMVATLVDLIAAGEVAFSTAAQVLLPALLKAPTQHVRALAETLGCLQRADEGLTYDVARAILARHKDKVASYRAGKRGLMGFFVGEMMREVGNGLSPAAVSKVVQELLKV